LALTLQWYYKNNAGDVVEIANPSRIRRMATEGASSAEEGAVGTWELEIDDPDGDFYIRGYRIVYAIETEAIADAYHGVIGVWFAGDRNISRLSGQAPEKRTGAARTWRVQLHDLNTILGWRTNVGSDCNRPAETDLARIAWILSTAETTLISNDTTYIDSTGAVNMDANDFRGQTTRDVIDDCAQDSGRNYGLLWEYSGDPDDPVEIKLWYKHGASTDNSSTYNLNNNIAFF
jgi:hypothetical protein